MRDDAVSPVVGVMIMLTVTVILAAVLTAFAGGFADTNLASPSADLSAEFVLSGDESVLKLSHNGGEPLNPEDITVSAYVRTSDSSGTSLRISEIYNGNTWTAGDSILLTKDYTLKLLGISESAANNAFGLSTPVDISFHHKPSSEIISKVSILMEVS